jgi:hypothetical protein
MTNGIEVNEKASVHQKKQSPESSDRKSLAGIQWIND